mmetsp:Transcript_24614/g.55605  ORF Transcript_24614/g.55605 Transcript_24614/m.55605 type:complete len:246 (-) Transcript_24614:403-1140(-)
MIFDGPTNNSDLHWQFDATLQLIILDLPRCQWFVPPVSCSKRMCSCFDSSPVVPSSDDDRINTVHDSLVVCACPIRIRVGEPVRRCDPLSNFLSVHVFGCKTIKRDLHGRPNKSAISQVGQNAKSNLSPCYLLNFLRQMLCCCVDHICAHGISAVEEEIEDKVGLFLFSLLVINDSLHLHASDPPSSLDQARLEIVGHGGELVKVRSESIFRSFQLLMPNVEDVHLSYHNRIIGLCGESFGPRHS